MKNINYKKRQQIVKKNKNIFMFQNSFYSILQASQLPKNSFLWDVFLLIF